VTPIVRDLLCPQGYGLLVTGHSLGAGTAALVTRLLSKEAPGWEAAPPSIRCVCFAPPPVLDTPTALASSSITSIVCNDDCVPRLSLQNMGRLSMLAAGRTVDEVISDAEEKRGAVAGSSGIPNLLVPGQVVMLHKIKAGPSAPDPEGDGPGDDHLEAEPRAEIWGPGEWAAFVADGTLPELNYVELAPASVSEHMAPAYREAIAASLTSRGVDPGVPPRAREDFAKWLRRATASEQASRGP